MPEQHLRFVATISAPGYLPMEDDPPVFDHPREAWEYLASDRLQHENDCESEDEPLSDAWVELNSRAFDKDDEAGDSIGSVYGETPGYDGNHDLGLVYTVSVAEEGA